jgi:uncharacterized membrane protein YhaH (DUF805 family)
MAQVGATADARRLGDGRVMINFLFNPNGRVSRSQIWIWYFFPQLIASAAARALDSMMFASSSLSDASAMPDLIGLETVVGLFFLWPSIAVTVKRYHDRGMSGWWVLWFTLIVAGAFVAAIASVMSAVDFKVVMDAVQRGVEIPAYAIREEEAQGAFAFAGLAVLVAVAAAIVQFVILYCLPGEEAANRFGPDPRSGGSARRRASEGGEAVASSAWADRLADPARLAAAAAAASAKAQASKTAAAGPAIARGARAAAWPSPPGARPAFGRRGV